MSKTTFAQSIISKLKGAIGVSGSNFNSGSASVAMTAVASAITEYIIANTQVTITYTGIISSTPPSPDPVVTDTFTVVGTCAPTGPSNSFDAWIRQIETNIISGFQLAPKGNAGIVFAQKPFLSPGIVTSQANLKSTHDVNDKDPQLKVWEVVCDGILNWINGLAINPAPGPASRPTGPSTGTAMISKIIIS